jgi:hypothetical protein
MTDTLDSPAAPAPEAAGSIPGHEARPLESGDDVELIRQWALHAVEQGPTAHLASHPAGGPAGTEPREPPVSLPPRARAAQVSREVVARELIFGQRADVLAPCFGISLAHSYVVALLPSRPAAGLTEADQYDILSTADGDDGGTIVLLPSRLPVRQNELRGFCERLLGCGPGSAPDADGSAVLVVAATARTRADIGTAFQETRTVHHVASALGFRPGVYTLADVPVEAALVRSPDLTDLLAERLFPLTGSGVPLLETLFVYQDAGQDRRQTARTLQIHPNTLDYRLRRIRELTGLSLTAPEDNRTLSAAATAWRLSHR